MMVSQARLPCSSLGRSLHAADRLRRSLSHRLFHRHQIAARNITALSSTSVSGRSLPAAVSSAIVPSGGLVFDHLGTARHPLLGRRAPGGGKRRGAVRKRFRKTRRRRCRPSRRHARRSCRSHGSSGTRCFAGADRGERAASFHDRIGRRLSDFAPAVRPSGRRNR